MSENRRLQIEEMEKEKIARRRKALKTLEWLSFIGAGLLIPIIFFLVFGVMGLIIGFLMFILYLVFLYVGTATQEQKASIDRRFEKMADRLHRRFGFLKNFKNRLPSKTGGSFLSKVPGFEKGSSWKKVFAVLFYGIMIMLVVMGVLQGNYFLVLSVFFALVLLFFSIEDEAY